MIAAVLVAALLLGVLARTVRAEEGMWQTDFKAALAKAKADKKYLLVDFTGSDWCGWCIKLHNEVFDKEPFKTAAPKQYVLVELDFPQQKKQSDELKKQNEELRDKFEIEGFPSVLLLDGDGQVIARTGYRDGGPEKYLTELDELPKVFANVAAAKSKLDTVQGLDRAKLLDQIIEGYGRLGNSTKDAVKEVTAWTKEVIALDPDNQAGLKVKYEFPMMMEEAEKLLAANKAAEARDVLDKALAMPGVPAEMRQEALVNKGGAFEMEGKWDEVLAALAAAKQAAPQSKHVHDVDDLIEHFTKIAQADQTVRKLEPELADSKGVDRARLLDKMIAAMEKLPETPTNVEKVEKWSKEVIELDADNQAGLKNKYQVRAAINDVRDKLNKGKVDEGNAALDKILETPGIGGEEKQAAFFLKAQIASSQHRTADEGNLLKQALAAAPDSEVAPRIKQGIAELEKGKGE
jgi:thioredoxin-related protein